jgi:diguanylate cyclase (GGDEF)-like protein/PAS domain S-box-containing protein
MKMWSVRMAQEEMLAKTVVDVIDTVIGYWNQDLRCLFANAAYEAWYGRSSKEMMTISIDKFLGPSLENDLPHIIGALNGNKQEFERDVRLPDGAIRRALVSFFPHHFEGTVRGFSMQVVDITRAKQCELALKKCEERTQLLASHDFLTGLPNRYLLTDRISYLLFQAQGREDLVGVVLMDIVGFGEINHAFGHDAGDGIMKEIARRMKGAIEPTETVVRMGGDEFLFLVPGIHTALELNLAISRILKDVQQPLQYGSASVIPRLWFGAAVSRLNATSASELLTAAENELGRAKRSER